MFSGMLSGHGGRFAVSGEQRAAGAPSDAESFSDVRPVRASRVPRARRPPRPAGLQRNMFLALSSKDTQIRPSQLGGVRSGVRTGAGRCYDRSHSLEAVGRPSCIQEIVPLQH